jgi:hypothetical protein
MIDFDRYRSEAYALRRQALLDSSKLRAGFKFVVIVVLLLGAVALAPSRQDANATCQACVGTDLTPDKASEAMAARRSTRTAMPEYPPLY